MNSAPASNQLAGRLARRIVKGGPITVADYMAAALGDPDHGYYRTADPLGAGGDFTTAPEISQIFGELIGAWLVDCWIQLGRPENVNLVELGPGRGTLMADALRAGARVAGWRDAIALHLVEINPALRALQARQLAQYRPHWCESISGLPCEGPLLVVANEFFDALPVRQLVYWDGGWRERLVDWSESSGFHFALSPRPSSLAALVPAEIPAVQGSVFEISPSAIAVAAELAARVASQGGAALIIDYGKSESGAGESLQAVSKHRSAAILGDPGGVDLSAHVDFAALRRVAADAGVVAMGPAAQGDVLIALGIRQRADRLKRGGDENLTRTIDRAVERLTAPEAMGRLFKVLAFTSPAIAPAGFEPAPAPPSGAAC